MQMIDTPKSRKLLEDKTRELLGVYRDLFIGNAGTIQDRFYLLWYLGMSLRELGKYRATDVDAYIEKCTTKPDSTPKTADDDTWQRSFDF